MLVTVSILGSMQRLPQLRTYLNSALNLSLDMAAVREALIQCSVFAGFPATVNSLELLRDVLEARDLTIETDNPAEVALEGMASMGAAMQQTLFGSALAAEAPRRPGEAPPAAALASIEQQFVFGELFYRPGLDLPERCLCALGCVVALGPDSERASWISACLRVGIDRATVGEAILQCAYYAGFAGARSAMRLLDQAPAPA
jgi:4-carboxymuconolactone decarboxylase